MPPAPVADTAADDPAAFVDPFLGTGSAGGIVGDVDTFPGPSLPFGMIQWSPDTPKRPAGGGYSYDDDRITGFSLTHLSGVGCFTGGDVPLLPVAGALPDKPGDASLPFRHADEVAEPGFYAVTAGGIRVELTTTLRAGIGRITYPRGAAGHLLVKIAGSQSGAADTRFAVVAPDEITGAVTSGGFCGQPNSYTVYVAIRFDRPFTASGTWGDGAIAGGRVTFDTSADPTVRLQVGLSYVDVDGARANLRAEATDFDVDRQRAAARRIWNDRLGAIRVRGGSRDLRTQFYTALYHSLLHPSVFSDADGRYRGFDAAVHTADRPQYAHFSGWDIYRSQIPLLALLAPAETSDMMTSLLHNGDESGQLPKWPIAAGHTDVMNGDAAAPMLASAWAFGARRFDLPHALDLMVRGAETVGAPAQGFYVARPTAAVYLERGYVPNTQATSISPKPNGASETLEYAIADFAIARVAAAVGRTDVERRFHERSRSWANLFDTTAGLVRPRDGDGAFPPGAPDFGEAGFGQSGFQEGNAAQYTFMVPHDAAGLIEGLGGREAAQRRLDEYFTRLNVGPNDPYHWHGNEPTFGTPWLYASVGAPWKTQAIVRRIMTELYKVAPGGEPGNDDLGALSSWYVWAAIGLYPQTPGVPLLIVGSPVFEAVSIDAGPGRRIEIRAPGAAMDRPYVHALRVDGAETQKPWLMLGDRSVSLDFTVAAAPDPSWGAAPGDAPPSFGGGPVRFPAATRAFLAAAPAQLRLAPGESGRVDVVVDNAAGAAPASVRWEVQASSGLVASPPTRAVDVGAGATAAAALTVQAAAGTRSGFYQVAIRGRTDAGAVLATRHVLVTVARPGEIVPAAYVSNFADGTVTPVDLRTRTAGAAIAVGRGPDGVVVTPDNRAVYVANNDSRSVSVIDTAAGAVVATVAVGATPADVAATPDGKTVWVSNHGDGTVQPIDTATRTAGAAIPVGKNPQRLRVSPDGKRLWVPNQGSGTVTVLDLASRKVAAEIAVGARPFGLAFADGAVLVGNAGASTLSVIDARSLRVTRTIDVGAAPAGLAAVPGRHLVYVTVGSGGVVPVDTATFTVGALIPTGAGAYGVAVAADGTAWVVHSNGNDVRAVGPGGKAGEAIRVGNVPDGIGLTH